MKRHFWSMSAFTRASWLFNASSRGLGQSGSPAQSSSTPSSSSSSDGLTKAATTGQERGFSTTATATTKPPNILIYQAEKDTTDADFVRIKESLESCLTPERYVIYPLGRSEVAQYTPWKENCRLLVVPATEHAQTPSSSKEELPPKVVKEMLSFAKEGGKLLSMHTDLNRWLGGLTSLWEALEAVGKAGGADVDTLSMTTAYCRNRVCDVEVDGMEPGSNKFSCLVPNIARKREDRIDDVYIGDLSLQDSVLSESNMAFSVPVEWNADMEWIDQSTQDNDGNNSNSDDSNRSPSVTIPRSHDTLPSIPCVREVRLSNEGCAVLSSVDLCPLLPSGLQVSSLVRLKKGVAPRRAHLTRLLTGFGLSCSEERLPDLTHTFLLCSGKVGVHVLFFMCLLFVWLLIVLVCCGVVVDWFFDPLIAFLFVLNVLFSESINLPGSHEATPPRLGHPREEPLPPVLHSGLHPGHSR